MRQEKQRVGAGPYFLARRGWQLVPEHAAATPTHSLQLLYMYVCSMCVHFRIHVWEALWMSVKNVSSGILTQSISCLKSKPTVLHINPNHIYIQVPRTQDRKTRLASLSQEWFPSRDGSCRNTVPLCTHNLDLPCPTSLYIHSTHTHIHTMPLLGKFRCHSF